MKSFDYITQSNDDIFRNQEVVELADILGFDRVTMDTSDVRKRLHTVVDFYNENGQGQGLVMYSKYLLSEIGARAGIHPLDVIYSYILSKKLLNQKPYENIEEQ